MKKPTITKSLIALLLFFSPCYLFAQPGNNNIASATSLTSAAACATTAGALRTGTNSATGTASISTFCSATTATPDVWYYFIARTTNPTVSLSGMASVAGTNNSMDDNPGLQIFNTGSTSTGIISTITVATLNSAWNQCVNGTATTSLNLTPGTALTVGNVYLVRVFSTSTTVGGTAANWNFNICVTDPPPANDNCANAITLPVNVSCSPTSGTMYACTQQSTAASCGAAKDVWYKFVMPSNLPAGSAAQVTVNLTNTAAATPNNLTTSTVSMELFSAIGNTTNCTGTVAIAGGCQNITATRSFTTLTPGTTYFIRLSTTTGTPNFNATFDICVTTPGAGRMNEVFKQTVLSNNVINTPWEITYGPDGYLWVTGSQDYKAYRIDPATGTPTTILDITRTSATPELTGTEHTTFNVKFSSINLPGPPISGPGITADGTTYLLAPASWGTNVKVPWPQGGFAGLAIHPLFNSGKPYVYISYVNRYDSTSGTNKGGFYFRNSVVQFTYNSGTGKLESPVMICDTLPGSNDHNSQRMIIAPVNGTDYLFYAQGDMGAGQLNTQWRPNHAQDTTGPGNYEGKILRFNLEPTGSGPSSYDKWIPDNNPYNHSGVKSAIWAIGIRNNQGFAYNPATGKLYGSSHGPYSDDEINIIEGWKNYGHPYIEGYSWDGNYNGNSTPGTSTSYNAGETFATNTGLNSLAPIGDEAANAATINASGFAPYREPLFSAYASGGPGYPVATKTVAAIWGAASKPGNGAWPSEAWSGLDIYTKSMIPGWKNSLLACGLKWGRVLRLKLNDAGDAVVQTNGADTVVYWQSSSRYRDIAFAPNGRDIFVSIDGSGNASGPAGVAPPATAAKCNNCIIKYTFLGYQNGSGNRSTIPASLDIATGIAGSLQTANKVVINAANSNTNLWVPITDTNSNVIAEINARGFNLDTVTTTLFTRTGSSRQTNGLRYVNRNITITPQTQPLDSVWVRLYISKAEFDQFVLDGGAGSIGTLKIIKNEDAPEMKMSSPTTLQHTTISEAFNGNSYVIQGTIGEFSSFYFGNSAIVPLPLSLLTFKGSLQNNATLLEWVTANEANTSKFIVERSTDGRNFQQIGTVLAAGNSSVNNNYSFNDYDVTRQSSSTLYYRLKMVDMDESYTYSDIVIITLPLATSKVSLFPNPASHEVNVTITTRVDGKIKWQLIDNSGRIVNHSTMAAKKGNNNMTINLNRLATGTYFLIVSGADIDQRIKLEKL